VAAALAPAVVLAPAAVLAAVLRPEVIAVGSAGVTVPPPEEGSTAALSVGVIVLLPEAGSIAALLAGGIVLLPEAGSIAAPLVGVIVLLPEAGSIAALPPEAGSTVVLLPEAVSTGQLPLEAVPLPAAVPGPAPPQAAVPTSTPPTSTSIGMSMSAVAAITEGAITGRVGVALQPASRPAPSSAPPLPARRRPTILIRTRIPTPIRRLRHLAHTRINRTAAFDTGRCQLLGRSRGGRIRA
jgi:hypothetical protein